MINRTLVRSKVLLSLFSYYSTGCTPTTARKELLGSFDDTYKLYFLLLDLVDEITRYADEKIEENRERAQAMHTAFNANPRFVDNRFAAQLFLNRTLRQKNEEWGLEWDAAHDVIGTLYKKISEAPFFQEYMQSHESSYEADKTLWRKIFATLLAGDEDLENALDELEIRLDACGWQTDYEFIISFIVKTIKRFSEEEGAEQPLLEKFDNEQDEQFALSLQRFTIEHGEQYEQLVSKVLKNWDMERVAFMDMVILKMALAELVNFPEIAAQITLNEYIELARQYSSENSPQFVNGVLDEAIKQLGRENKLMKAAALRKN